MNDRIKLRYLPTNEELSESALTEAQRKERRLKQKSPIENVYIGAARILVRQGLSAKTCPIWHLDEAYAEAKRRIGPVPLIR